MTRTLFATLGLACCALLAGRTAGAQPPDPTAVAKQYAESARQNATLMRQYSWKMRVEMTVDGKTHPAQIYQMRYDMDGKLQRTALTAPEEVKKKRGLIRGAIQKNKIEDFKEWSEQLQDLIKDYMAPSPGAVLDFYSKARMSPGSDTTAQVAAGDFLQKGDRATFWVHKQSSAPVRYSFVTALDEESVEGNVEFAQVTGGPRYPGRVTVSVPGRKVTAKVENFDFVKQQ